jgi:AbrB family looped-hinge helix DNA binding protein
MKLKLDNLGRVVLPKPLRVRYGLRPGTELEVREDNAEFTLRPSEGSPPMVKVKGIWVHQGAAQGDIDFAKALRDDREHRFRHVAGSL